MFENLSGRMSQIVKKMRGQARLTEENMQEMLREVRLALLEADVALPVVKELVHHIKEKALGHEVVGNLNPGQALVGVVHATLTDIMGGNLPPQDLSLKIGGHPPAIILLAGLQGSGKTTTAGKLTKMLRGTKKKVMTVSCDVYRPAAILQLQTVTEQAGGEWIASQPNEMPLDIAIRALDYAKKNYADVLIVDTAGRLGIDEVLMQEIKALHQALNPSEVLFVIDAMLGQDAVNTAKAFSDALPLTGVVLTKLDGDSRGGAALSVRHITGCPIKLMGVGEKIDRLSTFEPARMADRILGMGDIVALVQQAQENVDIEAAQKLAHKIKKGEQFDLVDFLQQLQQMKKMGGLSGLMDKLPTEISQKATASQLEEYEKKMRRMEGIIHSMTPGERAFPDLIKASRKKRIALGAGVPIQEVNQLLKQYDQMRQVMKKMKGKGLMRMMRGVSTMLAKR